MTTTCPLLAWLREHSRKGLGQHGSAKWLADHGNVLEAVGNHNRVPVSGGGDEGDSPGQQGVGNFGRGFPCKAEIEYGAVGTVGGDAGQGIAIAKVRRYWT